MDYLIRVLSFLMIPIIVSGVLAFLRHPKKAEKGKVYLPKFFLILGLLPSMVFLIPTIITAFSAESTSLLILFLFFSLLGAIFIIAFINCRISYDEDGFVAKNFFGIKRKFSYDQVTAIKEDMHEDYLYMGKHKITIDEFSVGKKAFIAFVRKKYRTIHHGQALPKIRKTKYDIFNGNIHDAGSFVFSYIMMVVLIVFVTILIVRFIYFTPCTVENTIEQQVIFESCTIDHDEIILKASNNQIYKIQFIDEQFNSDKIKSVCNGKTVVTTYSIEMTPDDEDDFYSIKAILRENAYLLSFDETNNFYIQEYRPLIFFPVIFAILLGAFSVGSIIVGRNPKKFSKKVVNLFFKKGYVKY